LDPRFVGSIPAEGDGFLKKIKSAARLTSEKKKTFRHRTKFVISFASYSCFLPDNSAGKIAREL
jgi:hypothetical protein